jgi:hypothetical protein
MALNLTVDEALVLCELLTGSFPDDLTATSLALEVEELSPDAALLGNRGVDSVLLVYKIRHAKLPEIRALGAAVMSFWSSIDIPPEDALKRSGILDL